MRIVSLLPAATEILYAIGAGDSVVGITHECDFPPEAARKPVLIRPRVDPAAAPADVDRQVRKCVSRGESLYALDARLLMELAPDLIVTQDLCHVCAASPEDLATALARLPQASRPDIVTFTPHTLAGVWQGIRDIAVAAGLASNGRALAARLEKQAAAVCDAAADATERPRVVCLEWFDPLYVAGHWVPEMVRLAGACDVLGREGEPSVPVEWARVVAAQPDFVLLMSCGYDLARNLEAWRSAPSPPGWTDLPAVRSGRVYAVDANAYFSRSGPRLLPGLALLATLFHPERAVRCLAPPAVSSVARFAAAAGSV